MTKSNRSSKPAVESQANHHDTPVLDLIRQLQEQSLHAELVSAMDRKRCVEQLVQQYSIIEIAKIFGVSERTIYNDMRAIRQANALKPNENFAAEISGELVSEARATIGQLRRVARESHVDPAVKVQAHRASFEVLDRLVDRLQRLGMLPSAVQRSQLSVDLHEPPDLSELDRETQRLMLIVEQSDAVDTGLVERLQHTRQLVQRTAIGHQLQQIAQSVHGDQCDELIQEHELPAQRGQQAPT